MPVVGTVPVALPDGERIVLTTDGSDRLAWYFWWGGFDAYEPETARLFRVLARRCAVILDVGAYSGYFSLLAAQGNAEASVFAFEPVPRSHRALMRNAAINGALNIVPQLLAVGDREGEVELYLPDEGMPCEASTLKRSRPAAQALRVMQVSLDSWLGQSGLDRVDLMKLDTEGTEHLVLRGAIGILEVHAPCIVCEVLDGHTENLLDEVLSPLGYRYFHITDAGPTPATTIRADPSERLRNYLFCPCDALGAVREACEVCPVGPV